MSKPLPTHDNFSYEGLVGIRHHVTAELPGIGGEIKNLLSDFIVQEITTGKDVIKTADAAFIDPRQQRKPSRNNRKYTRFVLKKFGCDTIHAVEYISRRIGVPSGAFSFAGIKDNQAISAQQVTVEGDHWSALAAICKDNPNFEISSIDYATEPVKTGGLWGNKFLIRIRDVDLPVDEIQARVSVILSTLEERGGFLNYFGLQRFGTHRPNSQNVGKCIVREDWEGAINELLIPTFPRETPDAIIARDLYRDTRDPAAVLKVMPKSLFYENIILEYLSTHPKDWKGALLALPRTIVSLYTYSYQSFLFNEVVSARFEKSKDVITPLPGDMVALLDSKHGQMTKVRYIVGSSNQQVLADYIKIGKATIVVPVVGSRIRLHPDNPFSPFYETLLDKEQIQQQDFAPPDDNELGINLQGVTRPLALYPRALKVVEVAGDDINRGKNYVRLSFDLPKGTYATMFLREIIKTDNQYL
ncbi:MAG: tRNA pseudouridine(13) synthase TruD [Candidatus Lokiarchaeota archaeon]|nr:tRNA pseudouridine(13) synthase TruD [Candidatus Lokiarchaeota archaeon]